MLNEQTKKEISDACDRMNETFDRMEKNIDEMSDIINRNLNKELEKNVDSIKVMVVKENWKNTVIERIVYFLLGVAVGLVIHYYTAL